MSEDWRRVEQFTRDLALAVRPVDVVAGGRPAGDLRVRVEGEAERPVRKPDGHYLFFDLPPAEVTVAVDGGDRYRDATKTVTLDPDAEDAQDPGQAVEVSLAPSAAYPFPPGLTRVRGTVRDGDTPVSGADVSVANVSRTFETTDAGEFVYYFDDVDADDVERWDPDPDDPDNPVERLYKPGGSHPQFVVDGPPGRVRRSVRVEVGTLTTTDLEY